MWGRSEIEGCMICQNYVIKLISIERRDAGAGGFIGHQVIVSSRSRAVDKNTSCYID
jgi:hypothetical protein